MNNNKRGFTLIELIVVIAIIGVLVLLAIPKCINYIAEAREVNILNDIKVAENKLEIYLIKNEALPNSWNYVDGSVLETAKQEKRLYDVNGLVTDEVEGAFSIFSIPVYASGETAFKGQYREISNDFLETKLKGNFYTSEISPKVYFIETKNSTKEKSGTVIINYLDEDNNVIREPLVENINGTKEYTAPYIEGYMTPPIFGGGGLVNITIEKDGETYTHSFIYKKLNVLPPDTTGFRFSESTLSITGYDGVVPSDLVIPTQIIKGGVTYEVKNINSNAFKDKNIKSVIIPEGIINIKDWAFSNNNLTSIIIPNSVETIGNYAFYSNQLTSVVIPNNVKGVGDYTFGNNKINNLTLGTGITSIGWNSFNTNELTELTIPDNVTKIQSGAFSNNKLTTLTIGNGVTDIEYNAFELNQLTKITIPANVNLGTNAISSSFNTSYTNNSKSAGIYTSTAQNGTWTKQ